MGLVQREETELVIEVISILVVIEVMGMDEVTQKENAILIMIFKGGWERYVSG